MVANNMRSKPLLILLGLLLNIGVYAQVHNTAQTLSRGTVSLSAVPVMVNFEGSNDFSLYLNAGVGLNPGVDIAGQLGFGRGGSETWWGLNIEKQLWKTKPYLSVAGGIHNFGDFGLDGTLNLTIPASGTADLYGGIDLEMNFYNSVTEVPTWAFVGTEIRHSRQVFILLEAAIGVSANAPNFISLGLGVFL